MKPGKDDGSLHLLRDARERRKTTKDINQAYRDICCAIEKTPKYLLPGFLIFIVRLCENRKVFRKGGINRVISDEIKPQNVNPIKTMVFRI